MNRRQPRRTPVGLEKGDTYKTPYGELEVLDIQGIRSEREWYMEDTETEETVWMDFELLLRIMKANVTKWE